MSEAQSPFSHVKSFFRTPNPSQLTLSVVDRLQADVECLTEQVASISAKNEALQMQLEAESARRERLQTQLEAESARCEALQTQLETESARCEALQTQLETESTKHEALQTELDALTQQTRKLAKTQFKANTLQESQLKQQAETLQTLQTAVESQRQQQSGAVERAQIALLKSLLPLMDSLDTAYETGQRQVTHLDAEETAQKAMLAWLDGVRLARLRLVDVLQAHNINRMHAVGQPFDPHRHVAVATQATSDAPDGTVVSVDRAGYETGNNVLREAEVVVARSG